MRKASSENVITSRHKAAVQMIFRILIGCYLALLCYLVFLSPRYGRVQFHRDYEIIPFKNIYNTIATGNIAGFRVNILGNIAAFIPLGFLVPCAFSNMRSYKKVLFVSLCTTLFIEILQFILAVGVSEIDDVILNVLGGTLGYMLADLFVRALCSMCEK